MSDQLSTRPKRAEVLDILKRNTSALQSLGVSSLALFGSVARDDAGSESDVDILVDLAGARTFGRYMDVKLLLEDLLGRKVDLVMATALTPAMRKEVEQDLLLVA